MAGLDVLGSRSWAERRPAILEGRSGQALGIMREHSGLFIEVPPDKKYLSNRALTSIKCITKGATQHDLRLKFRPWFFIRREKR